MCKAYRLKTPVSQAPDDLQGGESAGVHGPLAPGSEMEDLPPVTPRVVTFEAALAETGTRRRHLLLGNGFSRAYSESFAYNSLYAVCGPFSPPVEEIFALHRPDFEAVLSVIDQRRRSASDAPEVAEFNREEAEVKRAFLAAITKVHPDSGAAVTDEQKAACVGFLKNFHDSRAPLARRGRIFTTNYDLLLVWVMARSGKELKCYDDFEGEPDNPYFRNWAEKRMPDLAFLHGALHIYRHAGDVIMLRYRPGDRLVDQIRRRLHQDEFPVMVAEGSGPAKSARISASPYLTKMRKVFRSGLNDPNSVLFTFGHSLSEVDAHLLSVVGNRKVRAVYVGAYGGLASPDGERASRWAGIWLADRARAGALPLDIAVFDSRHCNVWGPSAEAFASA